MNEGKFLRWLVGIGFVLALGVWNVGSADGDEMVYISNSDADSVSVIDRKSRKVVRTFPVGDYPHHMLHSHDGKFFYIGNTHNDSLTVVDLATHRPVRVVPNILDPYNLIYDPARRRYICAESRQSIEHCVDPPQPLPPPLFSAAQPPSQSWSKPPQQPSASVVQRTEPLLKRMRLSPL